MYWDNITIEYSWAGVMIMNGQYKSLVVYDVCIKSGECVRTFNSIDKAVAYCHNMHNRYNDYLFKGASNEDFEIKTIVRIYWTED